MRWCRMKDISGMHPEPQMLKGNNSDEEGDSWYVLHTHRMPRTILRTLHVLIHLFLIAPLGRHYYLHFTGQKMKVEKLSNLLKVRFVIRTAMNLSDSRGLVRNPYALSASQWHLS